MGALASPGFSECCFDSFRKTGGGWGYMELHL